MKQQIIKTPFHMVTKITNEGDFLVEPVVHLFTTKELADAWVEGDIERNIEQYKPKYGASYAKYWKQYGNCTYANKHSDDERHVYEYQLAQYMNMPEPKNDNELIQELLNIFPRSFITSNNEFIANERYNSYFRIPEEIDKSRLKLNLFLAINRPIAKVYDEKVKNSMLSISNKYFGIDFTQEEHRDIYGDRGGTWEKFIETLKNHPKGKLLLEGYDG